VHRCDQVTINPVLNDTSPNGKYPLTLVSVATGQGAKPQISGNNVTLSLFQGGAKSIEYVVKNSVGEQSTGFITFTGFGKLTDCA
jgi:hypothetical protein